MKQSTFVIAIALLMLSACGEKSEKESTPAPASPPLTKQDTNAAEPSMPPPAKDKIPETTSPTSSVISSPAPEKTDKSPTASDSTKNEPIDHKKTSSLKQHAPIATGQPAPAPAKEQAPEKTAPQSIAATPPSPEKITPPAGKNDNGGSALNREEGLALANKSGCLACHKIETKLVGPAWRDVSSRYKGDPDAKARLIAKVKTGGKGNWTDVTGGITMPPYSPRVSDENIEKLVTFVLSQ